MWCWIVVAVLAYVAFSFFGDRFKQGSSDKQVDQAMQKIAQEINAKLPMSGPNIRVDEVSYSERTLRYGATTLPGKNLSDDDKGQFKKLALTEYCGQPSLVKHRVAVEYTVKVSPRFDDTRPHPWVLTLSPNNCG